MFQCFAIWRIKKDWNKEVWHLGMKTCSGWLAAWIRGQRESRGNGDCQRGFTIVEAKIIAIEKKWTSRPAISAQLERQLSAQRDWQSEFMDKSGSGSDSMKWRKVELKVNWKCLSGTKSRGISGVLKQTWLVEAQSEFRPRSEVSYAIRTVRFWSTLAVFSRAPG